MSDEQTIASFIAVQTQANENSDRRMEKMESTLDKIAESMATSESMRIELNQLDKRVIKCESKTDEHDEAIMRNSFTTDSVNEMRKSVRTLAVSFVGGLLLMFAADMYQTTTQEAKTNQLLEKIVESQKK